MEVVPMSCEDTEERDKRLGILVKDFVDNRDQTQYIDLDHDDYGSALHVVSYM